MKVLFSEVFASNTDRFYTPRCKVQIGRVIMVPRVSFKAGVAFSGVDIIQYVGHDVDLDKHEVETIEIKDVYR